MTGVGRFDPVGWAAALAPRGRDWNAVFDTWAKPASDTEEARCENAARMVRQAVWSSPSLSAHRVEVFGHGSYRNNTNVRAGSDVDVCVRCLDVWYPDYEFAPGVSNATLGFADATYTPAAFKADVEAALRAHFGPAAVFRGNKVLQLRENTYRVAADVAPTFERRRYYVTATGQLDYESGTWLVPDTGPAIENWPQQHYENGVEKNLATRRRYKSVVRILKRLRDEMVEGGALVESPPPSHLIECLAWNVPDTTFTGERLAGAVHGVLSYLLAHLLVDATCAHWTEVNARKVLFHPSRTWTRSQALSFVAAGSAYLGQ